MAFQQNAFQHNAFQVGTAGAAAAESPFIRKHWFEPNPWKNRPTLVFEQQNLLLTTLRATVVTRAILVTKQNVVVQTNVGFLSNNLLPTLLAVAAVALPPGKQIFDDRLWKYKATLVFEDQNKHLTLFNPGFPSGVQFFDNKLWKYGPTQVFEAQDLLNTLLTQIVVYPVGAQQFDAVLQKYKTQIVWYDQNEQLTLFNPGFPKGIQVFDAKLPKFQTSTFFEYQDLLNTVLISAVAGAAPTLYFDIETGRLALLLVDTTTPKIIMLL